MKLQEFNEMMKDSFGDRVVNIPSTETEYFAHKCNISGDGMNDGWCWYDGAFYTSTLEITLKECRKEREDILYDIDEDVKLQDESEYTEFIEALKRAKSNTETDDDLLLIAYQTGYLYYTEWYEDDFMNYKLIGDKLLPIGDEKSTQWE